MKGIFTALMCSFDEQGNINEQGLREIVRHNIDQSKVDGLYVNGSTGENFLITTEMKKRIFEIVKDEAGDQVKLIAQIGSLNIDEAVELGKFVTELKYDAISAVTPFYYKFDFEEIKDYYETIINEVNNDMIIYSIPALTGVNMSLDQFGELLAHDRIIGVKFTAPDFYLLERLRHAFPDKLIYSGFDEMLLPASVLNIDGAIGSTFNVNGKRAREIFELAQQGKITEALEIQRTTNDLISAILANGLYQTIKEMLKTKGVDAGYCRKPMKQISAEKVARAKELAEKYM
ncbi:N-acetylneuraminate lyase [Virgibacillus halodenitrificans]|uniref:N-acetylneuraminate lyase n=1 Tax=Virgibacillus halodenitrificans TaxID=1482 RepID=A0AAC9J4Q6_VIRHA|nr:N-acetylneuraminate lyase [Virgibacillus halodenitrificans]APC49394.1 N-acetylneuraminate lyase [Virgibacillus halodenitrificans]MBD1221037.1 N-acetylneuraminate lyase [Virgibacillus halodenitrificans]MCG1030229.1 N-acetylneuraminate lyase [Virgibacillus halodenitrificans]MCJ0929971.1 N-acetylneuraminate lyase [Virgibacillus halodenitrificans]MEC2158249.1 N-acetylneuraminate lyase [Virgibacillus halodenitrificans]